MELCYTSAPPLTANVLSQSGSEFVSQATKRVERYYQHWGRTHECVAVGAPLRPGEELSWQSVTRLFSPVCLSVRQTRGPDWMWGLWLSPLSGAESLSLPISSHSVAVGQAALSNTSPWFLCDGDEYSKWLHTTHEMLTGPLPASNRLTLFYSPSWLVNWSPAPCWHSDPNGGELLLSRHALTSLLHPPPPFFSSTLPPSQACNLCSHPPPDSSAHTPWFHSSWVDGAKRSHTLPSCHMSLGLWEQRSGDTAANQIKAPRGKYLLFAHCCPLISLNII